MAAEIAKIYRVPVKVENDANAAALAEAYWGAGRGYRHIFYAGLGTGIGTGIVFEGRIYNGRTGAATHEYRLPRPAMRLRETGLHRGPGRRAGHRPPSTRLVDVADIRADVSAKFPLHHA